MLSKAIKLSAANNDSHPRHNAGDVLRSERDPSALTEMSRELVYNCHTFKGHGATLRFHCGGPNMGLTVWLGEKNIGYIEGPDLNDMLCKATARAAELKVQAIRGGRAVVTERTASNVATPEDGRLLAEMLEEWKGRRASELTRQQADGAHARREEVSKQVSIAQQDAPEQNAKNTTQVQAGKLSQANEYSAPRHDGAADSTEPHGWEAIKLKVSKKVSSDVLLLCAVGDVYMLFFDDAILAVRELGVTLHCQTKDGADIPFCSLPRYGGESYINQLAGNGHYVLILEHEDSEFSTALASLACDLALQDWSLPIEAGWIV
jgi:hypothetical protein